MGEFITPARISTQTGERTANLTAGEKIISFQTVGPGLLVFATNAWHLAGVDWLMTHFRRLETLLKRRGRTREEAEDLIQEAFLRVKVYCDQGGEVKAPEAFLVRTVLNLARDARALEHRELYVSEPVETLHIRDYAPTPDEFLAAEDRLKELERTLDAINPRTREVFFMHRLDGLSYAQIADHFDVSVSAIEKHVAKAMAALGRQLGRPPGRSPGRPPGRSSE